MKGDLTKTAERRLKRYPNTILHSVFNVSAKFQINHCTLASPVYFSP